MPQRGGVRLPRHRAPHTRAPTATMASGRTRDVANLTRRWSRLANDREVGVSEATHDGFFGVAGLGAGLRRHAAADEAHEPAAPRPGPVHRDHSQWDRPGHQLRRHRLRLPGEREGGGRGAEGRLSRARASRLEAAGVPHAQDRGLRQVPGHVARAAADRPPGRLPAPCDERRGVREGAAPGVPRQDGGGARRRPHPAHRLLVPRHAAGVQEHRRRV